MFDMLIVYQVETLRASTEEIRKKELEFQRVVEEVSVGQGSACSVRGLYAQD